MPACLPSPFAVAAGRSSCASEVPFFFFFFFARHHHPPFVDSPSPWPRSSCLPKASALMVVVLPRCATCMLSSVSSLLPMAPPFFTWATPKSWPLSTVLTRSTTRLTSSTTKPWLVLVHTPLRLSITFAIFHHRRLSLPVCV